MKANSVLEFPRDDRSWDLRLTRVYLKCQNNTCFNIESLYFYFVTLTMKNVIKYIFYLRYVIVPFCGSCSVHPRVSYSLFIIIFLHNSNLWKKTYVNLWLIIYWDVSFECKVAVFTNTIIIRHFISLKRPLPLARERSIKSRFRNITLSGESYPPIKIDHIFWICNV